MKKKNGRPKYPMVDLSGLPEDAQKSILKALAEEEKRELKLGDENVTKEIKTQTRVVYNVKKRRIINANHPPEDVSQEELERIWGSSDNESPLREVKTKKGKKFEPSIL